MKIKKAHIYFYALTTILSGILIFSSAANASQQFIFTRDLKQGASGIDVQILQSYLNGHGFAVAASGPGSIGKETLYFGPLLKNALTKFQNAHAFTDSVGIFSGKTRIFVNGENNAATKYSVGGTITGVTSSLVIHNGDDFLVMPSGAANEFTFSKKRASGDTYAITVDPTAGQICTVSQNGAGSVVDHDITGITIACTNPHPLLGLGGRLLSYSVGGTVSGLLGTVVLHNSNGDSLTLSSNGAFTFAQKVLWGYPYSVSVSANPSSPSQTCTVTSGGGTIQGIVTGIAVTCVTNTFTVTASGDGNELIFPSAPQTVNAGSTIGYNILPTLGYSYNAVAGTCPAGSWVGNVYTTGPITSNCTVIFSMFNISLSEA